MRNVVAVLPLLIGGVIVAGLVKNPKGTTALFTGANNFWKTSVNGLLGSTTR